MVTFLMRIDTRAPLSNGVGGRMQVDRPDIRKPAGLAPSCTIRP